MGCTFEDIRDHALAGKYSFPSSTLNRILRKLVKKEILETDKDYRYMPHESLRTSGAEDMTVGDLLFALQFRGEYDLNDNISYQALNKQLASDLDRYFMQYKNYSSLSQKISEIEFESEESVSSAGSQKDKWGYEAKKDSYDATRHPLKHFISRAKSWFRK